MTFENAPSRARRLVGKGDTVVSTVRTYLRAVWAASGDLDRIVVSTGFAVLSPKNINPGFFSWWVRSDAFIEEVVARSTGVSYPAIGTPELGELLVRVPPQEEQQAIADYLDTETARIDALIEKKKRMIELLEERRRVEVELTFAGGSQGLPSSWDVLPLRRLCPNVTVGVVVEPSSYFEDFGVPFVHGTDIRLGSIDMANLKFMSEESNALLHKSQIYEGDVVAMRVGEPGRAAVVPRSLHRANCASILILRRSDRLSSEILCEFLNSRPGKAQIEAAQNGAAQAVMNVSDALDLRVPVPPQVEQDRIEKFLQQGREQVLLSTSKLSEQVALLAEKRQALITAAVTGELEIPGVAA